MAGRFHLLLIKAESVANKKRGLREGWLPGKEIKRKIFLSYFVRTISCLFEKRLFHSMVLLCHLIKTTEKLLSTKLGSSEL